MEKAVLIQTKKNMIKYKHLSFIFGIFLFFPFLFSSVAIAEDFGIDIDWIYYKDNSGREINYAFTQGQVDQYGSVAIPPSAVISAPASEAGGTYYWEQPAPGNQHVSLAGGVYQLAIPQATDTIKSIPTANIIVDGAEGDWSSISSYIEDPLNDVGSWVPVGSSADIHYLKLAYSPDNSKLYILMKLNGDISQDVWYRMFLDKNLNGDVDEPGDYQIDFQFNGSSWDVVSQSWNSESNWYPVDENGIVSVSGQVIEASVNTSTFGLPAKVNVYGRTMQNISPYSSYDRFSSNFMWTDGFCAIGGNCNAPYSTEWQFAARISDFRNVSQSQCYYGVGLGASSSENDDLSAEIYAGWFSGAYNGKNYQNALIFGLEVENDLDGTDGYQWEWNIDTCEALVLTGLNPETTVLDMKVVVSNNGQTLSGYYRLNSDDQADWNLLTTHTLPPGIGSIYGYCDIFPNVAIENEIVGQQLNAMPWIPLLLLDD